MNYPDIKDVIDELVSVKQKTAILAEQNRIFGELMKYTEENDTHYLHVRILKKIIYNE